MAEIWPRRIPKHSQIPTEKSLLFLLIGGESAEYEGFFLAFAFKDYAFAIRFWLCAGTRLRVDEYMWLNYLQSAGTERVYEGVRISYASSGGRCTFPCTW